MREEDTIAGDESCVRSMSEQPAPTESRLRLLECIERNVEPLLGSITLYVRRMGLDEGTDARGIAVEILQETVVEALDHADSFTTTRQPMAWLLGIALNVIRRKKVEQAKRSRREVLLGSLAERQHPPISDQDALDQIIPLTEIASDPGQALESDEQVVVMLSLVSSGDQEVLRLAVLEGLERETLARRLGISAGTARMRLHRALGRLLSAWFEQQKAERKGEHHE